MKRFFLITIFSLGILSWSFPVLAADVIFTTKNSVSVIGDQVEVVVVIDAESESINALEGTILFPEDLFTFKEIRDGSSFVNFWIQKPHPQTAGVVSFSGITPGGFNGPRGILFSIILAAKHAGSGSVNMKNLRILENDGKGTPVNVHSTILQMTVSEKPSQPEATRMAPTPILIVDASKPETFLPAIVTNEELFNGQSSLVFATQDKQTGIDRYEIKETRQKFLRFFSSWKTGTSPYVLTDQSLHSYVLVKAVDKAGNARILEVWPQHPMAWYKNYEYWVMIGGVIMILVVARYLL